MNSKNNLNYHIENSGFLLNGRLTKLSLYLLISLEVLFLLVIFLPLLLLANIGTALIVFSFLSCINVGLGINWQRNELCFYEQIKNMIRYKSDAQTMKAKNLISNNLVYKYKNTFAFIYENKLIIKSYFEITTSGDLNSNQEKIASDLFILMQEENLKIFSIKSTFNVKENLDKFNHLIKKQVNFDEPNLLDNNINKLLLQQLAHFTILSESMEDNNINVVEFSKEYAILNPKVKIDFGSEYYASLLHNYKLEESAFKSKINNIKIEDLNNSYLEAVKSQILMFNDESIECKFRYVKQTEDQSIKYCKYLKLAMLNPILDIFYLYELFNNQWKYEVSITYTSLSEEDESKIIHEIEQSNHENNFRFKKTNKRKKYIQKELTDQVLDEMLIELETQKTKSKALSVIVKIEADDPKKLTTATKEFCSYFKRSRMKFSELRYQQKQGLLDFHLGIENKINKKGKERKYRFAKRRFNNVNAFTLWQTAENCAYSLPIKESINIEPTGWIYGRDENWAPVSIDFDLNRPSGHIAIIGQTGGGKTTAAEYILNQKLTKTDHREPIVIILDPKNEYKNLVDQYNGITFDLSEGFANPFIRNNKSISQEDKDFVEEFLFNLLSPLKLDIQTAVVRLNQLIHSSNEWQENKFNFDVLAHLINYSEELKQKYSNEDYHILLDYINQYCSNGIKAELFNKNEGLNLNQKIISFNFSKLISNKTNSDTSTLVFCILNFLNNLMKQNHPKFREAQKYKITFFVDEFHLLVNAENTNIIKQFDTLYAISRSFGASVITIFQNLQILNNPKIAHHSKSIFENTAYLIACSQKRSQLDALMQLLPENIEITDYEQNELTSNKIHLSLIFYGNKKKFLKWNLGLFYDQTRDQNTDGLMEFRISEYKNLLKICQDYIEYMKEEKNATS